ncbi:conserved hypothetical protein [Ricinus communis]|uniref:FRIGIDA-like protein n=1 Tax=Ricinus communis TaxID=3988 RepID=B9REX7_RICCO|nr:conserved hypothetical protein [Ricinus communis]
MGMWIGCIAKERDGLRAGINCIATYCVENEFLPKNLKERVAQLEKEMVEEKLEFERTKTKLGPLTRSRKKLSQQHEKKKDVITASTAACMTHTTLSATDASVIPITITFPSSPPPTTVSATAPTTKEVSSSVAASTAAPITVTTLSPKRATHPATAPKIKKPKHETEKQKRVLNKRPGRVVSSGKPLNSSFSVAYHPQPAGQSMYYGAPRNSKAGYHSLADHSPSNSHFNPYDNRVNSYYHLTPPNSGYCRPVPSWKP